MRSGVIALLKTLLVGAFMAVLCSVLIFVIGGLFYRLQLKESLIDGLEASGYGVPIGAVSFALTRVLLIRWIDLMDFLVFLAVCTVIGGLIGLVRWDELAAMYTAVLGYLVGCVLVV